MPHVNRWLFRKYKIVYGKNMKIIGRVSVTGPGKIVIGNNFMMTSGEHINPISANLQGAFFTDSPNALISIGDNVGMSSTRMWIHDKLIIGNHVNIGAAVLFLDTDCHELNYLARRGEYKEKQSMSLYDKVLSSSIVVEDDVWIGAHCIILKGVTIGARSVIGAGSVVTKSIPSDCIAAGNPCKVIKRLDRN